MQSRLTKARARPRADRQAGFSVTELLVLTAPLCVLSMVLSSKLAATSSAHTQAEWQASLQVQRMTQPQASARCAGTPISTAPWLTPATGVAGAVQDTASVASQAGSIFSALGSSVMAGSLALQYLNAIPADLLTSPELLDTNAVTGSATVPVAPYYFQAQAEALVSGPASASASATFLCNEPFDGDTTRETKREQLIGKAIFESYGFYH